LEGKLDKGKMADYNMRRYNDLGINTKDFDVLGSPRKKKRTLGMAQKKWMWQQKNRHVCQICHKVINDFFDAEFDHKRAFAKGGATKPSSTIIVHKLCNRLKGKKSLSGIKKELGTHKPKKRKTTKKKTTKRKSNYPLDFKLPKFDFGI
jgi:hypothetical protein